MNPGRLWNRLLVALLALLALALIAMPERPVRAQSWAAGEADYWVEPMKKVNARFTGTPGTFAQFGDSITHSQAFWGRLVQSERRNMSPELERAYAVVHGYMRSDCWDRWKGPDYGNGGPDLLWALANVDGWLRKLNPEVAVILFGTQELNHMPVTEYEILMRELVQRCLKNGTVVILTTIPPRSGMLPKAREFAEVVRRVAWDLKVPLVDFFGEVLKRRVWDWDGTRPEFQQIPGDEYQVSTLISRDGVHPSNPLSHADYSEESLRSNGYALRTTLTLTAYTDVIRNVLQANWLDRFRGGRWIWQVLEVMAIVGPVFLVVFLIRYGVKKATAS